MAKDISLFTVPLDTPICCLDASKSFLCLTNEEKLYCHYLSRACWEGGYICLLQTSPESVPIFVLLRELFSKQTVSSLREAAKGVVNDDEFKGFLLYACAIFSNLGNYKSFGDTKIIPSIDKEKFGSVLKCSVLHQDESSTMERLWRASCDHMYSLNPKERQLGLGDDGITTYYSKNCTTSDIELVQGFMIAKNLEPYNTRLFKTEKDGQVCYELRLASALTTAEPYDEKDKIASMIGQHQYESSCIQVTRGDYAPLMQNMIQNLEKAKEYASNSIEVAMLGDYVHSFRTGSVDDHKDGSRHWIKNKIPTVETYIGFIESYRDPFGVRGEFEGFVAVVNKVMSEKFGVLVTSAEHLLSQLPWPSSFEKDSFLKPDFTSLDIVTFASSGIPVGINIPNYDDIRENEGFKNVSLGNVLTASFQDNEVPFLSSEDQNMFSQLRIPAFDVQVGLHELLGHGSGKLFRIDESGTFNFDISTVVNPLTNDKVTTWYGPGDTWDTKFRSLASPYEECKAECVGLYLGLSTEVLKIFGHEGSAAQDIMYVNWLSMVRSGLMGLEYYTPETKKWRQAHMQARYVILRVLLQDAPGLVTIEHISGSNVKPNVIIKLDRSKIETAGKRAIGNFLQKLQEKLYLFGLHKQTNTTARSTHKPEKPSSSVSFPSDRGPSPSARALACVGRMAAASKDPTAPQSKNHSKVLKSTANVAEAETLFGHFSSVCEEDGKWLSLRDVVLLRKMPRRMLVQPLTLLQEDGSVELKEFESTTEGLIQCYTEYHHGNPKYDGAMENLWEKDKHFWN